MASVSFRNSKPNRVSLKTSQNETHRGQFGHFALTIYKHFALHKSGGGTLIISIHQSLTNTFSQFSLNSHRSKTTNYIKLSSIFINFFKNQEQHGLRIKVRSSNFLFSSLPSLRATLLFPWDLFFDFAFVIAFVSCPCSRVDLDLHPVSFRILN